MLKTLFVFIVLFSSLLADDSKEVLSLINAYQDALNSKDAAKIAPFFSKDAEFEFPRTGEIIQGNSEIADFLIKKINEAPQAKIVFKDLKVEFKDSDNAIIRGFAQLDQNGKLSEKRARKIELKKEGGKWLIAKTSEIIIANPPDIYERLKPLEWLIGNWRDESGDLDVRFENNWDRTKNFIIQKFTSRIYENEEIEGLQIIGWDPEQKKIRSWIFDTDGGFGNGLWTKSDKGWEQAITYTLSDGRRASALNIFQPKDGGTYEYTSIHREVDGVALPDIEPVVIMKEKS